MNVPCKNAFARGRLSKMSPSETFQSNKKTTLNNQIDKGNIGQPKNTNRLQKKVSK